MLRASTRRFRNTMTKDGSSSYDGLIPWSKTSDKRSHYGLTEARATRSCVCDVHASVAIMEIIRRLMANARQAFNASWLMHRIVREKCRDNFEMSRRILL